jgi:hypothetical protein
MDNRLAMLPKRPENNRPRLMAVRYVDMTSHWRRRQCHI